MHTFIALPNTWYNNLNLHLTFWFGGQSSTVLQEAGKKNIQLVHHLKSMSLCLDTNTLTVYDAGVSETLSGPFPAWGTHTDLLKHTCTRSGRQK